jgi:hypothetical protein
VDRPSMLDEQAPEQDRQSVLAEVQRLRHEYLEAAREFERVRHLVCVGDEHPEGMNALIDAARARKFAFDRWVAAAARSAGED